MPSDRWSFPWTNSDARTRLSFLDWRVDGFLTMDYDNVWQVDESGRKWTAERMDPPPHGLGQRTIRNIKMWTAVDELSDGRKFVREGLVWSIYIPYGPYNMVHIIWTIYRIQWRSGCMESLSLVDLNVIIRTHSMKLLIRQARLKSFSRPLEHLKTQDWVQHILNAIQWMKPICQRLSPSLKLFRKLPPMSAIKSP